MAVDPFSPEEEEEDPQESSNLAEVRKWGKQHKRRGDKIEKEFSDFKAKAAERETAFVKLVARQKGVSEEQLASLFLLKPSLTVEELEQIAPAFIAQKPTEGKPEETQGSGEQSPEEQSPGTAPLQGTQEVPTERPKTQQEVRQQMRELVERHGGWPVGQAPETKRDIGYGPPPI